MPVIVDRPTSTVHMCVCEGGGGGGKVMDCDTKNVCT